MIMKTLLLALGIAFLTVLVSGCAVGEKVVVKVATVIAKPVFGLAVKDAKTTLMWVDAQEKSGTLAPVSVAAAKQCPNAVLALDELRTRMGKESKPDGFKGLIYYGTVNRFGPSAQDEASRHLQQLARECLPLVPFEDLIKLF